MRLALVGFGHEANTFAPARASLSAWRRAGILEGDEIRRRYEASDSTLAGFLQYGRDEPQVEVVPLIYSWITPTGASTAEAFEHLTGRMLDQLREQGPWDGVLLPQHGAAVCDGRRDADGEFIRRVRSVVGADVPIGVTLDMHANVSPLMTQTADIITVYQTNPHVDARVQALLCARLLGRTIRGEIRPVMALASPPLAINILRQGTADEPMRSILTTARDQEQRQDILSVSVVEGFPYADVAEMGMSVVVVADSDPDLAADCARTVALTAWNVRAELAGDASGTDDALRRARAIVEASGPGAPVVVLDMGDNVGGGSPGDSTILLHAARRLGISGVAQTVCDPEAAQLCAAAGAGGRVETSVGGKTDDRHGPPFSVSGEVIAVTDGRFDDPSPTHGGAVEFDLGTSAGLRTDDGFLLAITSRAEGTWSRLQFRTLGIEPADVPILIAKGVHAPRAAFEPLARELIWADTPGSTSADLTTFEYHHRRRPMYPFEPDAQYVPGVPT